MIYITNPQFSIQWHIQNPNLAESFIIENRRISGMATVICEHLPCIQTVFLPNRVHDRKPVEFSSRYRIIKQLA